MKVLIVSPIYIYPYYVSGLNVINFNLIENNPHFKADVLCLYRKEDEPFFCHEKPNITYHKVLVQKNRTKLLAILKALISNLSYDVAQKEKSILSLKNKLIELSDSYDVIHLSSFYSMLLLMHLPDTIKQKCVSFPVDSNSLLESRLLTKHKGVSKLVAQLNLNRTIKYEREILKLSNKSVFVSEVDAEHVSSKYELNDVQCIHNGVDTDKFHFSSRNEIVHQLIFTANYNYKPNKEAALFLIEKVLPLIYLKNKDIFLNYVGINPLDNKGNNFKFVGRVEDVCAHMDNSLFFVVPLFSGSGIKNKILEAMAMGKIVIGTKLSFDGISGEDNHHFLIVPDNDPVMWSDFIIDAVNNSEKYLHIKNNARKLIVEKYSWQLIQRKYKELYLTLLQK